MAISDNYAPDISLGNSVTTQFSGTWKVLNADYFKAALQSVATGIQTPLAQGSDYTLTFDDNGYEIDLAVAPSSDYYVVRYREVALDQTDPYRTSKGFQGKVVEDSFDKLTAIDQDQQDQIDRSLKFQVGSPAAGYTIEDPIDGRSLKWDVPNNRIVNTSSDIDQVVAEAEAARDAAQAAQAGAETAETNAETAEQNAEDWATKTNGIVEATDYSSKAYAIGGTGVTDTAGKGAAKEWATKAHGSTVDGSEYSAKHYSVEASNFAAAAASSAAEGLYNDVISLTSANSPYVPTVLQDGTLFRIDTTGGAVVINLSALSVYGEDMKYGFVKINAGANNITVNRGGTDTINGGTNIVLSTQYETHVIIGDDTSGTWLDTVQTTGIADNSVTNAKLADMANNTIKARVTAGAGDPEDATITQLLDAVLGAGSVGDVVKRGAVNWERGAVNGRLINTIYYTMPSNTVTISNASPAIVTPAVPGDGYAVVPQNGSPVRFTTTGGLPTGLSTGVTYWVVNRTSTTFQVSATKGGAAINTSSAGSGTHTCLSAPYEKTINNPSFIEVEGVGAGGPGGGSGGPGTNSGDCSFGSHMTLGGGQSGESGGGGARRPGGLGGVATGADFWINGQDGGEGVGSNVTTAGTTNHGGNGGDTPFGFGGPRSCAQSNVAYSNNGTKGSGFGSGAGGYVTGSTTANQNRGAGGGGGAAYGIKTILNAALASSETITMVMPGANTASGSCGQPPLFIVREYA